MWTEENKSVNKAEEECSQGTAKMLLAQFNLFFVFNFTTPSSICVVDHKGAQGAQLSNA